MKPKYNDNAKLCYTDIDISIIHIKTEDFYQDISDDTRLFEKKLNTSNYDCHRPLPTAKKKK